MSLPELVEIVPPQRPAPVLVTIPGSKSITNRALILGALAEGETTLRGALWSEDTEIMVDALRRLGYRVDSNGTCLPATIYATGPRAGTCTVSIEESSQFASALLLSSRIGGWNVTVAGEDAEESAYVAMTSKLLQVFPQRGGE